MPPSPALNQFESAVDAVITGDTATLHSLLARNPKLVRSRSRSPHRATLLHYIAANGVENERQKTPPNAVAIARILLQAGAGPDARAHMYQGRQTTLNMLVSSVHPAIAGLQSALVEILLDFGASINGVASRKESPLMTALHFGYTGAADTLARRGARIHNIAAAAGVGRLDLVQTFLPKAPPAQQQQALIWACLHDRPNVVEFLLDSGVDPAGQDHQGFTGLHWAAWRGWMDNIKLLLAHHAPLEVKNNYGGTVLSSVLWSAHNDPIPGVDYPAVVKLLIASGAKVGDLPVSGFLDPR